MRFKAPIQLMRSKYDPAIGDTPTPKHSSLILWYEIHVGRKSPNGHFVELNFLEFKGTLVLEDGEHLDLKEFTVENLHEVNDLEEGNFMYWSIDQKNKVIVL